MDGAQLGPFNVVQRVKEIHELCEVSAREGENGRTQSHKTKNTTYIYTYM